MKKVTIGIFALVLCLLVGAQTVFAGTCGTNITYTINGHIITFTNTDLSSTAVWSTDCGEVFKNNSNIDMVFVSGKIRITTGRLLFDSFPYVESMYLDGFDTSGVTSMEMMFYYCTSLKTIYVGEGWNTSKAEFTDRMFECLTSIVGGNGTKLDSEIVDATRAKIDGGKSNPGYFTVKK